MDDSGPALGRAPAGEPAPGWSAPSHSWPPVPQPLPRRSFWQDYGRHALLFVLTAASIYLTGGPLLTLGTMSIMLAHEMGHYLACRYYGLDATLPFFLPAPLINPLVGTFGAVIRIRSPFPNRRVLFDVGIAGPLAGFAVCLPLLVLGLREARVVPDVPGPFIFQLGDPMLFQWVLPFFKEVPEGKTLLLGPLGLSAWFGLFLTALNLIPIGQLDGGHVTYALFRGRAALVARGAWWLAVLLVFLVGPSWILWAVLVRVLGLRHPRTLDDDAPVGRGRVLVGLLGLAVFVACFLPNPFVQSWDQFFDALRELGVTSRS